MKPDMPDVPGGFALLCGICRWRPATDLPMGLIAAHFETEHNTDAVAFELVAVCPRCDRPMRFDYSHDGRDFFYCDACHRQRSVRRETE